MTIKQIEKESSYLFYCMDNYANNIRPADTIVKTTSGYKKLVEIVNLYIDNNLLDRFADYLMEGQYFIQLWTAHLILEYGQPNTKLKQSCFNEIIKYSGNSLAPEVSIQEKNWLENYLRTT